MRIAWKLTWYNILNIFVHEMKFSYFEPLDLWHYVGAQKFCILEYVGFQILGLGRFSLYWFYGLCED